MQKFYAKISNQYDLNEKIYAYYLKLFTLRLEWIGAGTKWDRTAFASVNIEIIDNIKSSMKIARNGRKYATSVPFWNYIFQSKDKISIKWFISHFYNKKTSSFWILRNDATLRRCGILGEGSGNFQFIYYFDMLWRILVANHFSVRCLIVEK